MFPSDGKHNKQFQLKGNEMSIYSLNKEYHPYVFATHITVKDLDELGHANYNSLKLIFETARHRFCKYLGFGRKTLRSRLALGLFMVKDSYEYHHPLKLNDFMMFFPEITLDGASTLTIRLKVIIWPDGEVMKLVNTVTYEMAMVNLKTQKPTRIPKPIRRSIEQWQSMQRELLAM